MARSSWAVSCPTNPRPMTATRSPGAGASRARPSSATAASGAKAACSSVTPAGTRTASSAGDETTPA